MKVKLVYFFGFLFLIMFSCNSLGKKTILYGKCNKTYFACTQIELKEDKTFEFYIFMDVGGESVLKGNWEFENGDTLKLNTFKQPKIKKTYFVGRRNENLGGKVKIKISDFDTPLGMAYIKINNGEKSGYLDEGGIGYFDVKEIKSISYEYLLVKETVFVDKKDVNDIEIFVRDLDIGVTSHFLVDEIVVANAKKIIFHPNTPEIKYSLKRSKISKKSWEVDSTNKNNTSQKLPLPK